jgi:hypothetical protein
VCFIRNNAKNVKKIAASLMAACLPFAADLSADILPSIHPQAVKEVIPLALKALEIQQAAIEREERHGRRWPNAASPNFLRRRPNGILSTLPDSADFPSMSGENSTSTADS